MDKLFHYTGDYRYGVGTLFFVGVWALLWYFARRSRHAMHWAGLAFFLTGPFFESLNQDYWKPAFLVEMDWFGGRFGFESLILAFTFSGISAGVYDLVHRALGFRELTRIRPMSYVRLLIVGFAAVGLIFFLIRVGHWNSVHSHIVALPIAWLGFTLLLRRSWAAGSLGTAAALVVVMVLFYFAFFLRLYPTIIDQWWCLSVMWGAQHRYFPYFWGSVPVEEFLWAASNALYLGPAVRFCMEVSPEGHWPHFEHRHNRDRR